jgi:hypothetical protein
MSSEIAARRPCPTRRVVIVVLIVIHASVYQRGCLLMLLNTL